MTPEPTPRPVGRLAATLQEPLTLVVRLRSGKQAVPDAAAFRAHLLQLLAAAEQDAIRLGYAVADVRLAMFAVVAFLDESALNARVPSLAEWARRPLQDELFGGHMGGEWFFQHIDQLLARPDAPELADLLEVYQLCLLLGFHGKFGTGDHGPLHTITTRVAERLARLRPAPEGLAPQWTPPDDVVVARDPWLARLALGAMVTTLALLVLWGSYALLLRRATADIAALAPAAPIAAASR